MLLVSVWFYLLYRVEFPLKFNWNKVMEFERLTFLIVLQSINNKYTILFNLIKIYLSIVYNTNLIFIIVLFYFLVL